MHQYLQCRVMQGHFTDTFRNRAENPQQTNTMQKTTGYTFVMSEVKEKLSKIEKKIKEQPLCLLYMLKFEHIYFSSKICFKYCRCDSQSIDICDSQHETEGKSMKSWQIISAAGKQPLHLYVNLHKLRICSSETSQFFQLQILTFCNLQQTQ